MNTARAHLSGFGACWTIISNQPTSILSGGDSETCRPPISTPFTILTLSPCAKHLFSVPSDYVQGLVSRKLEPDHDLASEASRNWGEIATGQLNFDRTRQTVEALKKIDGADLLQFFDR